MPDQTAYDKLLQKYVRMFEVNKSLAGKIKEVVELRKKIKGKSSLQYQVGAGPDCRKFMEALDDLEHYYDEHTGKKQTYYEKKGIEVNTQ
jgi:hypothetical protein